MSHSMAGRYNLMTSIAMCVFVFLTGTSIIYILLGNLLELHVHSEININLWFEADASRVFSNLTDRSSNHYRTSVHPLASLFLSTPTIVLIKLGLPVDTAARLVVASGAGTLATCFFLTSRRLLARTFDALIFTALLLSTTSFLFFASAFELYAWGGATIMLVLLAAAHNGRHKAAGLVAASALSLSLTVTNWMAGVAAAVMRFGLFRGIHLTVLAFALVAALAVIQTNLYPTTGRFLSVTEERHYVELDLARRVVDAPRAFFVGSVVLDRMGETADFLGNPYVTERRGDTSLRIVGGAAVALWLALVIAGACAAWSAWRGVGVRQRLALLTPLLVVGQLLLHLVYGEETVLYSPHYVPLLVLLASFAARTSWRRMVLATAATVAVLAAWHNIHQLQEAYARADQLLIAQQRPPHRPRDELSMARQQRPQDYWPRNVGHIPLGLPGGPESDKAYLEPGGSLSPGVESFGVSIWIRGAQGLETSDTLPLKSIHQRFVGADERDGVGVRTETSAYVAEWRQRRLGEWSLALSAPANAPPLEIALRSAGPAGGPITAVEVSDHGLIINRRWRVEALSGLRLIDLGAEGVPGWSSRREIGACSESARGWCVARFSVIAPAQLAIHDLKRTPFAISPLASMSVRSAVTIEGGDSEFGAALDAQIVQILMGTVGREARPGDPINYPLAWQRDASYIVAALARAGRLDAAKILVEDIAKRDFFGGFGAEADAPGLGLWAMGVVSRGLNDRALDQDLWPHVYRKAQLVEQLATATTRIRADFEGPLLPQYKHLGLSEARIVADPSEAGLINGRMDWHRPRLYLTAISIRGLAEAARIARRLDQQTKAQEWDAMGERLAAAYRAAIVGRIGASELKDDRTLMVALDPTQAAKGVPALEQALQLRWGNTHNSDGSFKHRPLWTYFELAIARQWLRLGAPDRTWATVKWLWENSPSPGLYSLWESDHEENSSGRWDFVRGWVNPPHVTPHYWASAEMVLTQIAMLAYADNATVFIGAGVPAAWLSQPLRVRGLITDAGPVSWTWDGTTLNVAVCDPNVAVRGVGALSQVPIAIDHELCASSSSQ